MNSKTLASVVGLLAILCPLAAQAATATEEPPAFKPASACPLLFGGPASIARNMKARTAHLEAVEPGEHVINLTHTGAWQKPTIIRLQGVELTATGGLGGDRPTALVEVTEAPGDLACQPGLYEIGIDNSIGGQAHVLAIVDGAVLLDYKGELRFIQTRTAGAPTFRMIWRSTWTIAGAAPAGSGPTPSHTSANPVPGASSSRHKATRPRPAGAKSTSHRSSRPGAPPR